ncbi:MAG: hypothetical protein FJZ47_13195 [Candidatus Tectomicrobia bacterium]|uniref:Heme exporter protein B n=1 Tax=Tectimicrobiota bacterium TaxID=2528274 RepID=A0A938B4K3_UNCTE|nr:hypothetical protein [Candidatus Tectomicrobia bacterium]
MSESTVRMSGSKIFVRQILAVLGKDLRTEWRTREIFTSMFVFAVLVVVVFNFAIGADTELIRQVASGVMWVALLFSTVLGLQRARQLEGEEESLSGVLLALYDSSALFIAKTIGQMLYLMAVALAILPLCGIWFRIDFLSCWLGLCLVFLLGMFGLSIIGTLFSMITLHTRAYEVMLPMLFLPISIPLTIAAVYATVQLVAGKTLQDITDYLVFMGIFDVVFFTLSLIVFDFIIED